MTEDEWQTKDAPRAMLEFVRPRATTRQLRYFGAACCRQVWDLLPDDRLRAAVECVEDYAAGTATKQELAACQSRARLAIQESGLLVRLAALGQTVAQERPGGPSLGPYVEAHRAAAAVNSVALVARPTGRVGALGEAVHQAFDLVVQVQVGRTSQDTYPRLYTAHAAAVRCIFGNPFRPVVFDPSWRTEASVALARGLYESRDFAPAPVLADALEDAGCDDARVLDHLRRGGVHVRGCWCVDAVLARA
jgi:hypothetical protein